VAGFARAIGIGAILLAACASPPVEHVVQPSPPGSDVCAKGQPQRPARRNLSSAPGAESPYPLEAVERGIQGWVCVEYSLAADGAVTDAKVVASAPQGVFEGAALAEVRQWQFELLPGDPWAFGGQQVLVRFEMGPTSTRSGSGQ
jgi:protein TonB